MERFLDRKITRRDLLIASLRAAAALTAGSVISGCSPESKTSPYTISKKAEGGVAILTFTNGKNSGEDGKCERRFLAGALKKPQITDEFELPASDKKLNLNFTPGLLDKSVNVIAQIYQGNSNPTSMWEAELGADFNAINTLEVSWKSFELDRAVIWNGIRICFNPTNPSCKTVALSVE